jgi:hypothetical protein
VAHLHQRVSKLAGRLERPSQRAHRVPARIGFDQIIEVDEQVGIDVDEFRTPSSLLADPVGRTDTLVCLASAVNHGITAHP